MADVLLALVGPTASGKTRMAVEVAQDRELGGVEILSCDSMGVYRGLDIAADKPSGAERAGVPHHLFDVADHGEEFTAVHYRDLARTVIAEVQARGHTPMLVGGSGLWFRAVVDDLRFAPSDRSLRRRLEESDPRALYARLRDADPCAAERIDPRNVRRVVRAVEIMELTGRPPTELRGDWERREGLYALSVAGLTWARAELYRRASERVRREIDAGLVEEVRAARDRGLHRTAWQALGVKEILQYLDGKLTLEEAAELNVRHTKAFIRRQLSWFRADPRVGWVDASELGWEGARGRIVRQFSAALGAGTAGSIEKP